MLTKSYLLTQSSKGRKVYLSEQLLQLFLGFGEPMQSAPTTVLNQSNSTGLSPLRRLLVYTTLVSA